MSPIRPFLKDDLPELRRLFRQFPYKALQQRQQGLDAEKLAALFTDAESARLEKIKNDRLPTRQWIAEEKGKATAFAALHDDAWHSQTYPFKFGRLAPFLTHGASDATRHALIETLLEAARAEAFEHLTVRIDGAEYDALHALCRAGFYLVDSSVKLCAPLAAVPDAAPPSRAASARVRPWRPDDLDAIRHIASSSHPMNHFLNDPLLEADDSRRLFERWVERCCDGLASDIFVLDRRGQIEGFVIYLDPTGLNRALATRLLILDFVCLADGARGGGLGHWFIAETLRRLADDYQMVELRTGHHNYPALTCYQSLGMRIVSTDFILHRHETRNGNVP